MHMSLISLYLVKFESHKAGFALNVFCVLEFSTFDLLWSKKLFFYVFFFACLICFKFWFWFWLVFRVKLVFLVWFMVEPKILGQPDWVKFSKALFGFQPFLIKKFFA